MKFLGCCFILFCFGNVSNVPAQSITGSVIVLPLKISAPADAKKLGTIKEGNNATEIHCDYEAMIASAKQKAGAMGGNIVKITQLRNPAFISKCYAITADVYYAKELSDYRLYKNAGNNPPDTKSDYATLYIYRLPDTTLSAGYKLHLNNDSVICSVKSKSKEVIKIYSEGQVDLWAQTEKRTDLKVDVKAGHDYYIRCGLKNGEIRMVPVLQLMDNNTGVAEYTRLGKKKRDTNVNYLRQIH